MRVSIFHTFASLDFTLNRMSDYIFKYLIIQTHKEGAKMKTAFDQIIRVYSLQLRKSRHLTWRSYCQGLLKWLMPSSQLVKNEVNRLEWFTSTPEATSGKQKQV